MESHFTSTLLVLLVFQRISLHFQLHHSMESMEVLMREINWLCKNLWYYQQRQDHSKKQCKWVLKYTITSRKSSPPNMDRMPQMLEMKEDLLQTSKTTEKDSNSV